MSYRVEISVTKTAGCQAPHCKKENVKIQKGEIRQGVLVTAGEFTSMKWRHWGCVTPPVLHNWWESAEHDVELVDGLDTLPEDAQEKVKRALEQGHVDDADFNGDIECNRWNGKKTQGMFLTAKQKEANEGGEDEGKPKKAAGKKRGRPAKAEAADEDDDEPEKPAAKKGKKAAAASAEDATTPKKGRGRPKKAPVADVEDDAEVEVEVEVAPKKARGRPRKSLPAEEEVEAVEEVEAPSAKKARGRPRKSVATDVEDEVEAPVKKARGRPKAVKPQAASDEITPKKGRGRPRKSVTADEE